MIEIFGRIIPEQPTIAEQEAAYTTHYENWFHDKITPYMKERFIVGKDPKNCEPCYFLNKDGFVPPRCLKSDQPIYQIDTCLSGPMIQKPKTIDEVIIIGNALLIENRGKK